MKKRGGNQFAPAGNSSFIISGSAAALVLVC
jgi:hypothetical protein